MSLRKKPEKIGICALECYFPKLFVNQSDLEAFTGASQGKYTIGLGQQEMAFCSDREDIYSLTLTGLLKKRRQKETYKIVFLFFSASYFVGFFCLILSACFFPTKQKKSGGNKKKKWVVVSRLLKNNGIAEQDIGRLSVASETIADHSKSIKSVVMQLFEKKGNTDIEGVDYLHACYAGTASLFDSVSWMESERWDGRYAIVVCADIAEYAKGPARPTGGACAVAMLIGPNAPIQIGSVRASYMCHAYDFYKPYLNSPYPQVDGHLSNHWFLQSLDECYKLFCSKCKVQVRVTLIFFLNTNESFRSDIVDYWIFHSPFNKLVRKGFARVIFNDFYRHNDDTQKYPVLFKSFSSLDKSLQRHMQAPLDSDRASSCLSGVGGIGGFESVDVHQFKDVEPLKTYSNETYNTELMNAFVKYSSQEYDKKVSPSTFAPRKLGNSYTASLYLGLCSLISQVDASSLMGRKVAAFSYGSGICSTLFTFEIGNFFFPCIKLPDYCIVRVCMCTQQILGNDENTRSLLQTMHQRLNLYERLNMRHKVRPQVFDQILDRREEMFHIEKQKSYRPTHSLDYVFEDAFVLTEIDGDGRRFYSPLAEQKQKEAEQAQAEQTQPEVQTRKNTALVSVTQTKDLPTPLNTACTNTNENTVVEQNHQIAVVGLLSFALGSVVTLAVCLTAQRYSNNQKK
ncbi:hypothetical protein RFI_12862 [Reticulomyxa filosa]|uniref:Hydroxymethylglutaryl-CoA synthase n=1 Tax=Reticulomyxa filosa TaxID=46433 RepID=X6NG35_RETFI|nr:hypothetical protein RFI_12862 [Reticulomyxa filosa]|eukprot:ETO24297.1 hypothetical protein RFI_12862 [Reticulomyxa filosa]